MFFPNCFAQSNLVPNGSFETFSTCPASTGNEIDYAVYWFQPNGSGGSSDLYNTCSGHIPYYGYPSYQYPRTGNGYAGIILFFDTTSFDLDRGREYIEVGLIDSLKSGKKYCVRFFANKDNWGIWAIKNIQAVLTNDSLIYHDVNYGYITGVTPIMEADSVITDTLNWIPIQTTYTAHGGEKFITIGNFSSGATTIYKYAWPYSVTPYTLGYYLIDDVSIYEQPDVNAGNDTLIPPGDSVQLGIIGRPDITYSWSPTAGLNNPNIANPIAKPSISTIYVLTVTDTNSLACTNVFKDTVNVQVGYLGVKENSNSVTFNIYPNPVKNNLCIVCNSVNAEFIITDVLGEEIKNIIIHNTKTEVDLSDLKNGIYFIKELKENVSKKIIVLH